VRSRVRLGGWPARLHVQDSAAVSDETENQPRSGRCAIVGRPNVGKSTLLNALLRQKLVIATSRPGTTRSAVLGVYASEDPPTQIAFVDTPGLARPRTALHQVLVEQAQLGLAEADAVLMIVEPPHPTKDGPHPGDAEVVSALKEVKAPVIVAINKVDLLKDKTRLFPHIQAFDEMLKPAAIVPLSAKKRKGLDAVLQEIRKQLPEGLLYEDEDFLTDRPERFFVGELIREAAIRNTRQEVPYGVAVLIDSFTDDGRIVRIQATVVVEKDSHKGIVIGRGGERIKQIGTEAREGAERFLDRRVHLELWVKVIEGWTADPERARRLATEGQA